MSAHESELRSASAKPQAVFRLFRNFWVHVILLFCVLLFIFPFFWMFSTSVKTDEELLANKVVPEILGFQADSPYVRDEDSPDRPEDVTPARWKEMLPTLMEIAEAQLTKYQASHGEIPAMAAIDQPAHRQAAANLLVEQAVAKMDRRLWEGSDQTLLAAYRLLLTDAATANALTDSLGKLQLLQMQLRTLDLHVYNLLDGEQFADKWQVESGPGKLFKWNGSTLLSYQFASSWDEPIVLRYDFSLPKGAEPKDLYKLSVAIGADDSWHRVYATLDMGDGRWQSKECIYIAQHRAMSLLFQPPTFDDQTMRPKIWTTIKKVGESPTSPSPGTPGEGRGGGNLEHRTQNLELASPPHPNPPPAYQGRETEGVPATLRLSIYPSSTLRANWGKMLRNYDRAVKSVPVWLYFGNSMILVILCVAGSIFSATFVAYAFARLNWPGRSAAFLILLATMMLPSQVTMVPGFLVWRQLHWYNTLNPIWVPAFFGSAFFIFLMTQHMRTIPRELEEAARLDGLNSVQSWYYMILPQVTPTLTAIAILSFMSSWNEFMGPLIYLRDQSRFPLSLGLYGLGLLRTMSPDPEDFNWTVIMAGNMLMTIPVIVVFFVFQRYFVKGMTLTGMKG
jgi:multiple sugar transport system permease protein